MFQRLASSGPQHRARRCPAHPRAPAKPAAWQPPRRLASSALHDSRRHDARLALRPRFRGRRLRRRIRLRRYRGTARIV